MPFRARVGWGDPRPPAPSGADAPGRHKIARRHDCKGETLSNDSTELDQTPDEPTTPVPGLDAAAAAAPVAEAAPGSSPEDDASAPTDEPAPAAQTFADLGVLPSIVAALAETGIVHPFPIQSMAIPIALTGTDMIGQARTGTGKTLAFGITLLQRIVVPGERDYDTLAKPGAPQALVVAPTRELASQVGKDIAVAAAQRKARVLTIYGGVGYDEQLDTLKAGVEVVVGTPGRLLDLADRRALDLSHVKVLVLDEADEMLDLGFLPDVERLLAKTSELRQTMLFSATMPSAIVSLSRRHLRHPVNIRAESGDDTMTVPATAQFVYQAHDLDKPEVVARILQAENRNRVMIFCRTKRSAQRVSDDLAERGFSATSIHGDLSQIAREKALTRFRSGSVDVLVATDVAARGIDVEGVTHVINYECPDDEKTYVHRIGRTGRAGASGVAITFVDWPDRTRWKVINNILGLPFEEPEETYSTSPHLYHDQGIEPGTKGRLNEAPAPAPSRPRESGESRPRREGQGGRSDSARSDSARSDSARSESGRSDGGRGEGRPRTDSTSRPERSRRRLKNGVAVDGHAGGDNAAEPSEPQVNAAEPAVASAETPATEGTSPAKRRRRRRSSGAKAPAAD